MVCMVSAVQVRKRLAEVIDRAAFGKERVILARRGKVGGCDSFA